MNPHLMDCGLEGDENEVVQVRTINRILNRINIYHVQPMKKDIGAMTERLNSHINDETEIMAEIRGGIKVLKGIGFIALSILVVLGVPAAEYFIKLLK